MRRGGAEAYELLRKHLLQLRPSSSLNILPKAHHKTGGGGGGRAEAHKPVRRGVVQLRGSAPESELDGADFSRECFG